MTAVLNSPRTGVDRWVTHAALDLFDTHGYRNVDELDIALRAGITVAELQTRFVDKQEVLGTILDRATDTLFWRPIDVDGLPAREALECLVREHLRLIAVDPRVARVVVREHVHLENPYRRSWATRTAVYRERWLDAVRVLQPDWADEQAELAVFALLHLLNTATDGDPDDDRLIAFGLGMVGAG